MEASLTGSYRDDEPIEVLLVEDNPGDVRLVEEAFTVLDTEPTLKVASNGAEAIELLSYRQNDGSGSLPNLVLLDLNLPRMDGFDVLDAIESDLELGRLPVLVLTSSESTEDVRECYRRGANAYLTKPVAPDEFDELVRTIESFWVECVLLPSA